MMQKRVKNIGAHRVMITIIVTIISVMTRASVESKTGVENKIILSESSPTSIPATKSKTETGTDNSIDHQDIAIKKAQKIRRSRIVDRMREYVAQRLQEPKQYLRYAGYCVGTLISIIMLRATINNIKIFNKSPANPNTQDATEKSRLKGDSKNSTGDSPIGEIRAEDSVNVSDRINSFVLAALNGDHKSVNNLLAQKIDVNTIAIGDNVEIAGYTALHVASREGHTTIIQLLLDNNADANKEGLFGYASLHVAAESGQRGAIELLLASKADINMRNQLDQTPGDIAQAHSDSGIIALLLNKQTRK